MVRLRSFASSRIVYSVRQRDYGSRNPLLGVRLMFVVAALLFTVNSSMADDPSCASDKPGECFLPGPDFDVKSIYPDGDVTIDDDRVNIELKGTQKLKWPSVKVHAPKKLSITVTAELKEDGDKFRYAIGNLQFVFVITDVRGGKAEWSVKLVCISSSDTIPPDGSWSNPAVTVELSADDEVTASSQGKSGEVSRNMKCPSLYADDVVLINPKAGEIKGKEASVTMKLEGAKIMLRSDLGPTTAAPTTTGNGPCVNGTCETVTCMNGTCWNGTDLNTTTTSSPAFPPWAIGAAAGGGVLLLLVIIGILLYFFVIRRRPKAPKAAKNGKSKETAKKPNKEARPEEEPPTDLKSGVKDAPKSKGQELPPDQPPVDGAPAPAPAADPAPAPAADPAPAPATGDQYENLAPPPQ